MWEYLIYLMKNKMHQKGQGMTEYALLLAFVVVLGVVIYNNRTPIHDAIANIFSSASERMN